MRLPHPIVLLIGASIWIGLLLWQVHRERVALAAERSRPLALENHRLRDTLAARETRIGNMEAAYGMVQREADRHAIRALVAEGKLNQCEASAGAL